LVNPTPGVMGNVSPRLLEGPGALNLQLNLIKRIQLWEGKLLELRADATGVPNHPSFSAPNGNINSPAFGRITTAAGSRVIGVGLSLSF
jgi:hypothetical protein